VSDPVTDPGAEFGAQLWESVVEALTASNSLTPSYLAMARTCHAVDVEGNSLHLYFLSFTQIWLPNTLLLTQTACKFFIKAV